MQKRPFQNLQQQLNSTSHQLFRNIFLLTALILIVLPFWNSLQDVLTKIVMSIGWYRQIQNIIVPYELKVTGSILSLVGFPIRVGEAYMEWTRADGKNEAIYLVWNCVGWQSLVLLVVTLLTGLSGKHTWMSKIEALAIGFLGTYLINMLRLSLVVAIYFWFGRQVGVVFHDYFSNLMTIAWLFVFWRFSYTHVLVEKPTYGSSICENI